MLYWCCHERTRPRLLHSHSSKMAELPEQSFENFLSTLHLTTLYLQRFIDTGYDDIDLLIDATKDELEQMFDIVGMSTKPGHVLKFKKSLEGLKTMRTKPVDGIVSLNGSTPESTTQGGHDMQLFGNFKKPQDVRMKKQKSKSVLKLFHI